MSFLDLKNVTKIYPNGTKAVHETSLSINEGEFMVFVGPSGCGKSTLLRMVAGLEDITEGDINLDGKLIPENGRTLKCGNCDHVWHYKITLNKKNDDQKISFFFFLIFHKQCCQEDVICDYVR